MPKFLMKAGSSFVIATALIVLAVPANGAQTDPIPDFTGTWRHPVFPWYEPPASGPGPIRNLSRWPESAHDNPEGLASTDSKSSSASRGLFSVRSE